MKQITVTYMEDTGIISVSSSESAMMTKSILREGISVIEKEQLICGIKEALNGKDDNGPCSSEGS